jgi:acyl-CoA reductase-like NAD-dependent aldehyde dehydrogenase
MANDTIFGLAAYFYTRDSGKDLPVHGGAGIRHRRRQ